MGRTWPTGTGPAVPLRGPIGFGLVSGGGLWWRRRLEEGVFDAGGVGGGGGEVGLDVGEDVGVELAGVWHWGGFGELHGVDGDGLALFDDFVDISFAEAAAVGEEVLLEEGDGVALLDGFDLVLGAVFLGVGHAVALVAVGEQVDEGGAAGFAAAIDQGLEVVVDVEDVHAVDLDAFHSVGGGFLLEVVGHGCAAFDGGAHGVAVVLDDEDDGDAPEAGEVHAFVESALVEGTVAEVGEGDFLLGGDARGVLPGGGQWGSVGRGDGAVDDFGFVLGGEGEAGADGCLGADDAVAAEVPVRAVEHVHGATLALGAAGDFSVHFGHAGACGHAAGEGVTVVAVRGDDWVVVVEGVDGADGEGFLADVEVTEAADFGLLVGLGAAVLKLADEDHVAKELDDLLV